MVIIVPHHDDEIFCYSFLKKTGRLVIVFKGGGEPKGYILDPEELYKRRCNETLKTCKEMGVTDVSFLGVQRPYTKEILDELGISRYCCRRMFISHVDVIDDILKYYEATARKSHNA